MSAALKKHASLMTDAEFSAAVKARAWRPKPEQAPVLSREETAIRRKIILNLPSEQLAMALKMKEWRK